MLNCGINLSEVDNHILFLNIREFPNINIPINQINERRHIHNHSRRRIRRFWQPLILSLPVKKHLKYW
jgi:hypothetical protein